LARYGLACLTDDRFRGLARSPGDFFPLTHLRDRDDRQWHLNRIDWSICLKGGRPESVKTFALLDRRASAQASDALGASTPQQTISGSLVKVRNIVSISIVELRAHLVACVNEPFRGLRPTRMGHLGIDVGFEGVFIWNKRFPKGSRLVG